MKGLVLVSISLIKSDKVELGVNFSPSYSIEDRVDRDNNKGVVINALMMPPVWPVYNEDGSYNYMGNGFWKIGTDYQHNAVLNPVAMANLTKDQVTHANLLGNFYFQWEIIKGLKYKFSAATNYNYFFIMSIIVRPNCRYRERSIFNHHQTP